MKPFIFCATLYTVLMLSVSRPHNSYNIEYIFQGYIPEYRS